MVHNVEDNFMIDRRAEIINYEQKVHNKFMVDKE